MPIIDGYDDLEVGGFSHWTPGPHRVTITGAKLANGKRTNGTTWLALEIAYTRDTDGASRNERVYYPANTQEWLAMKEGQRKAVKSQLRGLGIDMSELESEQARAALIGKQLTVEVKVNGDFTNYYFQKDRQDGVSLPEPERATTGEAQHATGMPATAVVV